MATDRGAMAADLDIYIMAADAAARSRDEAGMQTYLGIAEESAARANHKLYMAIAQRARGVSHLMAGELEEAAIQLTSAINEFRNQDTRWQIGLTLLELGEVEQLRGNNEPAKRHYSESMQAFKDLNAAPGVDRARAALDSLS